MNKNKTTNKTSSTVRENDQPVRQSRSANNIDTTPGEQHGGRIKQKQAPAVQEARGVRGQNGQGLGHVSDRAA